MEPYSEQEQVEKLKAWWKRNGTALVAGVVLGVGVVVGNNLWKNHKLTRAEKASALYEQMMVSYSEKDADTAQTLGGSLMDNYAATPYAAKAALYMARISFERSDRDSARAQLRWAIQHATDPATAHVARLRLARLMEAAGELEQALKLIAVNEMGGFESNYEELRGDLLAARGRIGEARAAYRRALERIAPGSNYREVLAMKLDDLGQAEQ